MGVARKLLERASRQLELPAEIVAGLPRIEVTGTGELSIEPHRGLLEYAQERISIDSSIGAISVTGEGLTIKLMNRERITVTGCVYSIELPGDSHG